MNKVILPLLLFSILSCSTHTMTKTDVIRPLANQSLPDGCGCYLKDSNGNYFYWNDFGSNHYLNINGKDVVFKSCKKSGKEKVIGDSQTISCENKNQSVRISLKKTSICEPTDEGCEFTRRSGFISIIGNKKTESQSLSGGCGC